MEITSFHFLLFVTVVLVIYYLMPHRAQNIWLLIASYVFYIFWTWKFAILLFLATIFHFELAKRLRQENKSYPALLWLGIGTNIVLFMIFKASSFYVHRLTALLDQMGFQAGLFTLGIVIPLGLSYYVLQNISYLVDVYRGQMPASTNRVDFALYLAYFPKMVAGPIERARTFLPMLARPRHVDNQILIRSLILILIGLTRKLLIANLLFARLPYGELIGNPGLYSRIELIGWLVVYAFGLYNDFAGYTNIVRGVSGLFGIELSRNFNTPYFSRNFTEFWNRWHITLSQWLRDYIFYPVSRTLARRFKNRNSWQNLVIPPMLTMLVSGFWHGPNWQMLLWGAIHGFYLVAERLVAVKRPTRSNDQRSYWPGWASSLTVFFFVILAWVPFVMRVPNALGLWQQLLTGNFYGPFDSRLIFSLLILIPAIWLDWTQYDKAEELYFLQQKQVAQAFILATVITLILIVTNSGTGQPFVYQGF
jgi:D-alanyl-lipoteichoic acid acyltransferase DltB (MBOAT superfamily)